MKSTTSSMLLFFLTLIFYAIVPALSLDLYESVCSEAGPDANSCINALKGDKRIVGAKNYLVLSKLILKMAVSKTKSVQSYYAKVHIRFPEDNAIRRCTIVFFPDAMEDFETATLKLDYNTKGALDDINAAGREVMNCDKVLRDEKSKNPSVYALNNGVFLLSKIASLTVSHFAQV